MKTGIYYKNSWIKEFITKRFFISKKRENKPEYLAEVISKPSAEGAAGYLLAIRGEK